MKLTSDIFESLSNGINWNQKFFDLVELLKTNLRIVHTLLTRCVYTTGYALYKDKHIGYKGIQSYLVNLDGDGLVFKNVYFAF